MCYYDNVIYKKWFVKIICYNGLQVSKDTYFTTDLATCDYISWPKHDFNNSTQINQILKLHEKHAT